MLSQSSPSVQCSHIESKIPGKDGGSAINLANARVRVPELTCCDPPPPSWTLTLDTSPLYHPP